MAISGTTVASVFTSGNATSYATGSYTPTASRLMVCSICSELSGAPVIIAVTGNDLTWLPIASYQADTTGTQNLIAIYAAYSGESPSAGAVTVDYGVITQAGGSVIVDEYDGVDMSGLVTACFVQTKTGTVSGSGTSETITLDSGITTGNASGGVFQHQADETSTEGSGYSILGNGSHSGPSSSLLTEYLAAGSTTVDASWTTSAGKGGIAFELLALSGTEYTQSASGGITPAGAISKQDNKPVAGTVTSAGTISKSTSKILAGTLTSVGTLIKETSKILAGTLTTAGALEAVRLFVISLDGTLTSAGALIRDTSKSFAGTLTSAGTLIRDTAKSLAGTITSAGAATKETGKALSGTLTSAGAISKAVSKIVSGTLTTAGTISRAISKILSGVFSSAGGLASEHTSGGSSPVVGDGERLYTAKRVPAASIDRQVSAIGRRSQPVADDRHVAKATNRQIIQV